MKTSLLALLLSLPLLAQFPSGGGTFPPNTGGGGGGTITSIATSCGTSGGTITTSGTIVSTENVNAQSGTSYAIVAADCGELVTGTNASAEAYTIAAAGSAGFPAGFYVDLQNRGAGTLTLTPTTSTIDGAATLVLASGQGARIASDGTNYYTQRGVGSSGSVTSFSCVTANGVSCSVATATTTPAATFTLGAITPTSIAVGPSPPALTPGTGSAIAWLEGTAPSICATSGVDCMYADSTLHAILFNFNGGTYGSLAPLASPTFTGVPAAPTASAATNSTQLATTAYVTTGIANATSGVLPVSKGGTQAQGSNVCGTSDLCATGTIAQAAITNLSATTSTFISLIAAPASGSMISVDSAVFELVLGGATTYGSGAATSLYYGQSAALVSSTTCQINFIANTASRICFFGLGGNTQNTTAIAATGIYLGMASGSSYTCASTCGSVYYVIKYHIVTGL